MNKAAKATKKVGARSKAAVKPVKKRSTVSLAAAKPVKKAVKRVPLGEMPLSAEEKRKLKAAAVPLAEVEVLAAKAVKMIKAKRSVSPEKKARRLASVAATLERARGWGGLSKSGAWGLKHPFGLEFTYIDWEAVLR